MKITKEFPGLIDEGYRYKFEGSILTKVSLTIDLDKPLYVSEWIEAGESIKAGMSIKAGEWIKADGSIKAGESIEAKYFTIHGLRWTLYVFDTYLKIGCQMHSKEAWKNFDDVEISEMEPGALSFWNENKHWILAL